MSAAARIAARARPMDVTKREAAEWVRAEIDRLRGLAYEELLRHEGVALHSEMITSSGDVWSGRRMSPGTTRSVAMRFA
jgi:hypothetical protein